MALPDQTKHRTLSAILTEWCRSWGRQRTALGELEECEPGLQHIAHDVGLSSHELRVLAARRPDAADLLSQRLDLLRLAAGKLGITEGAVLRDLQRVCTICGSKRRCARDLADRPLSDDWQRYCPNAGTLQALVTEEEDEKALAHLERRGAHAGRIW